MFAVVCGCQLSVEAQMSQDALLVEFVQLYVQLRQVKRLVEKLFAAVESQDRDVYLPGDFCTRFVRLLLVSKSSMSFSTVLHGT